MGSDVTLLFVVVAVVVVALVFDFTNGFHDSANAMAGPIATGALRPRTAVILAAVLNLVGAGLLGWWMLALIKELPFTALLRQLRGDAPQKPQ